MFNDPSSMGISIVKFNKEHYDPMMVSSSAPQLLFTNLTNSDNTFDFDFEDFNSFFSQSDDFNNLTDVDNVSSLLWEFRSKKQKGGFEWFVDNLNLYLIPVIIVVGLVGNIISALVFTCTHLRRLSSSLYLTFLSLADVGFLLALTIAWLDRVGVHWMTMAGWCQCVVYVTRVCACLSVWFVLSFTTERYIIVYHALRKDQLCTKRKAKIVIGVICAITLLLYVYIFPTYDVIVIGPKKICAPNPKYNDMMTIMTSIDTVIACVVPSIAILILNARIIRKLHEFQNNRLYKEDGALQTSHVPDLHIRKRPVLHTSISTTGSMRIKFSKHDLPLGEDSPETQMLNVLSPDKCQRMVKCRSQLRTARMLLVVSSMFVMLNLPSHVFRVQAFLYQLVWDSIKTPRAQYNVHEFFELFFFLNFATNFFVYSMCGKQFRIGLQRLCKRVRYRVQKSVFIVTSGIFHQRQRKPGEEMQMRRKDL